MNTEMNTPCGVARDLMPLAIDGAASEESVQYVEAHVKTCAPCAAYYQEMRSGAPGRDAAEETRERAALDRAAELMRKKRLRRVRRNVLLGIILGVLLIVGGYIGWQQLYLYDNAELPVSDYHVTLAKLENGSVVISMDYHGTTRSVGTSSMAEEYGGQSTLCVWNTTSIIPRTGAKARNGLFSILSDAEFGTFDTIYQGRQNKVAVYHRGDEIKPASKEMEAYFAAERAVSTYETEQALAAVKSPGWTPYNDSWDSMTLSAQQQAEYDALTEKARTLYDLVPEWQ